MEIELALKYMLTLGSASKGPNDFPTRVFEHVNCGMYESLFCRLQLQNLRGLFHNSYRVSNW